MGVTIVNVIRRWFKNGVKEGKRWMIVVTDEFDWEDHAEWFGKDDAVKLRLRMVEVGDADMLCVREVYDLNDDMEEQLAEEKVWRAPDVPVHEHEWKELLYEVPVDFEDYMAHYSSGWSWCKECDKVEKS